MSVIYDYLKEFAEEKEKFDSFHNQVINMPRDEFSETDIPKLQTIAAYLFILKDIDFSEGYDYKIILGFMADKIKQGVYPIKFRDEDLENRYFKFNSLDEHYDKEGRMFRHLMGTAAFFGMIKTVNKFKKYVDFIKCQEYLLADGKNLYSICRNNLLNININSNDYISSLKSIDLSDQANYRPAAGIINYIKSIGRPVTSFELAILLGRIDDIQSEEKILDRALKIGAFLPVDENEQKSIIFRELRWVNSNDSLFTYATSQQPDFKFRRFILFMISFGLLNQNSTNNTLSLTEYSKEILATDIPFYIADLEKLFADIDDDTKTDKELRDLILYQRNTQLLQAIRDNTDFIIKMNQRSIRKPLINNGKRQRNPIIAELAKIKAGYKCQYSDKTIFKMPNGKYYIESHHIIHFNEEDGPDITENLIVLGPEPHRLIHHAAKEEVDNLYRCLVDKEAIEFAQFKNMHEVYGCLTKNHIDILFSRNILNSNQKDELIRMLK